MRAARGLSVSRVAREAGVSFSALHELIRGEKLLREHEYRRFKGEAGDEKTRSATGFLDRLRGNC